MPIQEKKVQDLRAFKGLRVPGIWSCRGLGVSGFGYKGKRGLGV